MVYEIEDRYQPIDVLMHEYFHDLPKIAHIVEKLPNLFDFDRLRTPKNAQHIRNLKKIYLT